MKQHYKGPAFVSLGVTTHKNNEEDIDVVLLEKLGRYQDMFLGNVQTYYKTNKTFKFTFMGKEIDTDTIMIPNLIEEQNEA